MKSLAKNKKGQFVIIAVLLVAIMIVSVGALLHNAVTYYKHEPWQEYSALIGDIELNSRRLLELSLINYTQTGIQGALNESLSNWRLDLARMYPGRNIVLDFTLAEGSVPVYGEPLTFAQGLVNDWNQSVSVSSARANFTLSIGSIGLTGYKFTAETFLKMSIIGYPTSDTVDLVIVNENNMAVSNLKPENFKVNNLPISNMTISYYAGQGGTLKYTVGYQGGSPPYVEVWDLRGIRVTGL